MEEKFRDGEERKQRERYAKILAFVAFLIIFFLWFSFILPNQGRGISEGVEKQVEFFSQHLKNISYEQHVYGLIRKAKRNSCTR